MRLEGKTAFITGGSKGIGKSIAELYAKAGAAVAIADIDTENGQQTAEHIKANGGNALFIKTDVCDPAAVQQAIQTTTKELGALHILVNNAGGSLPQDGPITEVSDDTFWKTINLDLYGTWLCCKHGIPELVNKAGGGSVINVVSFYGLIGSPSRDAYTSAKGAVISLTRSMAVGYAEKNIRVNGIAPGTTLTERSVNLVETIPALRALKEKHLLGLMTPEDIAHLAIYLGSDESLRTTGQIFALDSGLTTA